MRVSEQLAREARRKEEKRRQAPPEEEETLTYKKKTWARPVNQAPSVFDTHKFRGINTQDSVFDTTAVFHTKSMRGK